ncbi:MAG: SEC-C domain-containing protein [Eubacterium sp.]|nr:SEC-C domain-containing protein [Eubacterium sp.]
MNTDYATLGLEPGASPEEIKKAYFKQVRLHSPESDPEQFQAIRQAYENLKRARNKPDAPVFPALSDPMAVKMMRQIQAYRKEKNITCYRDACEEAWKRFPDDIQFLYLLIMAQRRCGNTGKAVKNAELLASKDPENKWFQMVLAFSYKDRGFTQKALTACEKAYALGCRDIDFLLMYASFCDDNLLYDQGIEALFEVIRQDVRWSREQTPKLIEAYTGLLAMNQYASKQYLMVILDSLYQFLEHYSIYVKEYMPELSLLLANACMSVAYQTDEYKKVEQIFSYIQKACTQDMEQKIIQSAIELYHFQRVLSDPRIDETMITYLELLHDFPTDEYDEDDEIIKKFAVADIQLCMIEERESILQQAAVLQQEHPQEYALVADFVQKLKSLSKLRYLKDSILKNYYRMEPYISGGHYYEQYPQEKIRAMGIVLNKGAEDTPYVRSTQKIGRNDPCPCGSGKKYKHCCMNK